MSAYLSTVNINAGAVALVKRNDPETLLRKFIKLEFEDYFEPYTVKFFQNPPISVKHHEDSYNHNNL